jgi:hypothetical protein
MLTPESRQLVEAHLELACSMAWWFFRRHGRPLPYWCGCKPVHFDDFHELALIGLVMAGESWDGAEGGVDFAKHARKEIRAFIYREHPWRSPERFFGDLSHFNAKGDEWRFDPAAPTVDDDPPQIPANKALQQYQHVRVLWRWHVARQDAAKIAVCENLPEGVVERIIEEDCLLAGRPHPNPRKRKAEFILTWLDFQAFAEGRVPGCPRLSKRQQRANAATAAELDAVGW